MQRAAAHTLHVFSMFYFTHMAKLVKIDSSLDDVIKQEIYDNYDIVVRYSAETYSSSHEYPITNMYGALIYYTTVLHRYKRRGAHFRISLLFREFGVFEKELLTYVR